MFPAQARAASAAAVTWGGDLALAGFHTTDLFPGGPELESDNGLRLVLKPEVTFRLAHGLRVKPWVSWTAERYDTWSARNLDRWEFGLDVRRGPVRLRGFGGFTRDELYFPRSGGDVRLDRDHWGFEGRYEPAPGWMAQFVFTRDHEDFIPIANERDDRRTTLRSVVERRFDPGKRLALSYVYRHANSVTDLYTYAQNAVRLEGEFVPVAEISVRALGEFALRDYRTGRPFASNFGREDDRWRGEFAIGHALAGPVRAEVRGAGRRRTSTRSSKDYSVREIGLAITATR